MTIEKICVKGEGCLDIPKVEVNDVELFKLDFARYIAKNRKRVAPTVTLQYKDHDKTE